MGPLIVIPARSGSSRFPNKPLALLRGRSLVGRTWDIATAVPGVSRVIVATDCEAILHHAQELGAEAMMTPDAANGCDRAAYVLGQIKERPSVVVNLQGDAVLTPVAAVQAAISGVLGETGRAPQQVATVAVPLTGDDWLTYLAHKKRGRASGTTVVMDVHHRALYFSKCTLPHQRNPPDTQEPQAWRHLGLYAFAPEALLAYAALPPTPLETIEGLEQLRWLEHGHRMQVVPIAAPMRPIWSIDYPEDMSIADAILLRHPQPS